MVIFEWELDALEADHVADDSYHDDSVVDDAYVDGFQQLQLEGSTPMDEKDFQTELQKALDSINELPEGGMRDKLLQSAGAIQNQSRLKKIQESMDLLRVHVKYIMFDLEATKRENKYLRQLLDESGDD